MANWIKWWKSKFFWTIFGIAIIAMVLSFLSAYFLPSPWGLICVILVCIPSGIAIRKLSIKKINEWLGTLEEEHRAKQKHSW